jgi:tetratricopeptide (TPR) repeat protein
VNSGKLEYFSEILDLYKSMLKENLLFIEGYLPAWEYKNIVTAALRSNDLQWAENFLESYKSKIEPSQQENAYTYNMASFLYECNRHKEALRLLHNVVFINPTYHVGAKIIQIKIFTESGDWDIAMSSLDAFAGYLRRNKEIAEYQKKSNLNFISASRSLIQLVSKSEWKADEKLTNLKNVFKTKLDSLKPLPSGDWLQEVYDKYLS